LGGGPVVGGVIGQRRLLLDLGVTPSTSARARSFGVPGRINVAASTRELLADRYEFETRETDVKGLGRSRPTCCAERACTDQAWAASVAW
jgi:hypothetical protein